jgi:cephalosporin hydroxylase
MAHENPIEFELSKIQRVSSYKESEKLLHLTNDFFFEACKQKYSYDFTWLGLPVIQFPEDLISLQEIISRVQPDVIIETGIARGGSLVFYASLLKLLGKGITKKMGTSISLGNHTNGRLRPFDKFYISIKTVYEFTRTTKFNFSSRLLQAANL